MPSNIVLECSQYQSNSASNSQWTTTFSEEVVLAENDIFQLQQCLLNTQTVSSGSINIQENTDVTIQVAYYEHALGTYFVKSGGTNSQDQEISDVNTPLPYAFTSEKGAKTKDPDIEVDTRQAAYDKTIKLIQPASSSLYRPAGLYLLRKPRVGGTEPIDDTFELYTADITIQILSGVYDPAALADLITKKVSLEFDASIGGPGGSKGLLINLTDPSFVNYGLVGVDLIDKTENGISAYTHQVASDDTTSGAFRMLGATTFELSFNAGVFSFSNLHTPIMGATGGGDGGLQFYTNPSIGVLKTGFSNDPPSPGSAKLRTVDCYSGCVITNLTPTTFWNRLGFTTNHIYDDIVFNDTAFVNIRNAGGHAEATAYLNARRVKPSILLSDFRSNTNVGLSSFNTIITYQDVADTLHRIPDNDTMELVATTITDTLDGDINYIVDEIGYYRVEAETVISNDYKQQGQRLGAVVGIVSTNYSANDFVIGYGDGSSIAYQHSGAPQVISAVNISIINPLTNAPVVGMGKNSTVFMEVVKAPPQPNKLKGKKK